MTLTALLMLAEKATAGSRELDYAIAEWAHSRLLASYRRLDGDNGWYSDDPPISGANKIAPADAYTFSIDCALGLVERLLPGWRVAIYQMAGHWQVSLAEVDAETDLAVDDYFEDGPTAPLAILRTLLRSLISQEHKDGQP